MAEEITYPRYRWLILFIGWAVFCLCTFDNVMIAVRGHDLIPDLGITLSQFYLINTSTSIAPIILCIVGGMLGDRFGVKRIVAVGAVLATAGSLLRLTATGFVPFLLCMILLGAGIGVTGPNAPKLVGIWFPPKQTSIAVGIFMTGLGLGSTLGLALGPLFPTWRSAVLIMGILLAVATVAWIVFARDRPAALQERGIDVAGVPFKEGLGRAVRSRNLWWLAPSYLLISSVLTSYVIGLPRLLEQAKGVSPGTAGLVVALSVVGFMFGSLFWTAISERVGVVKPFFILCTVVAGAAGLATYVTAPGLGMWVFGFFPGFCMGGALPILMQLPIRLPEFGPRYAGTPTGIIAAVGHTGSVIMLPYMFTPIWHVAGPLMGVVFLAVSIAIGGVLYLPLPETGRKVWTRWLAEAQAKAKAS